MSKSSELAGVVSGSILPHIKREWVHAPIVCVDTRGPLRFRMLSEQIWGTELHHDGRSFFCTGRGKCVACAAGLPKRWAGWVPACSWDYRLSWVVKVSAGAHRQLTELRKVHPRLVGLPLTFKRALQRSNSAVLVSCAHPPEVSWDSLPPSFDPRGAVLNLHQVEADIINQLLRLSLTEQRTSQTPTDK